MATFEVGSHIDLKAEDIKETHGLIRTITSASISDFKQSAWAGRRGVYIFSLRGQGGVERPWYVGLAKGLTFGEEAMTADKLRKYAAAMFGRTGSPLITLVAAPLTGPKDPIDSLETLLIWVARARNPKLLNERKINSAPAAIIDLVNHIEITGVLNKGAGKPSNAAQAFRKMMGLT